MRKGVGTAFGMKVAFFTDGLDTPSGRFRVEQFLPRFRAAGIECTRHYGYGSLYNQAAHAPYALPYKLACRSKRALLQLIPRNADLLFLQRPALPHTAIPEQLGAMMGHKIIHDFDDAIHLGPGGAPSALRERAFHDANRAAVHLIAGNANLAMAAGLPAKTTVIPTVIDTDLVIPAPPRNGERVVLGWMGTSSNFPNVLPIVPALAHVLEKYPHVDVRFVSNARLPELDALPRVEQIPWSRDTEIALLQSFDVGLMPLVDTAVMRGKCAFKLIQYMAVGRPAIGSGVGANIPLLEGQGVGAVVPPNGDWFESLRPFIEDAALRRDSGERARARAVSAFSVDAVLGTYLSLFQQVAAS